MVKINYSSAEVQNRLYRFGKGDIGTGVQCTLWYIHGIWYWCTTHQWVANAGPDLYFVGYSGYTMFTGQMFVFTFLTWK